LISSTQNCNEFRFFEPRFTSLAQSTLGIFIIMHYINLHLHYIITSGLQLWGYT